MIYVFRFPQFSVLKKEALLFATLLLGCTSPYVQAQNSLPVDTIKTYYPNSVVQSAVPYYQNKPEGIARYYYDNHNLKEERTYIAGKVEGVVKRYNENGALREMFTIENGKREGALSLYDENGNYVEDKFYIAGKVQPPDTSKVIEAPAQKEPEDAPIVPPSVKDEKPPAFVAIQYRQQTMESKDTLLVDFSDSTQVRKLKVRTLPELLHGAKHFYSNLSYPSFAKKRKIEGVIKVKALVDKYGDVLKTEALNSLGWGCEESAEIAVFYTKFVPAVVSSGAVPCYIIFPVEFKIAEVKK